VPAGTQRGRTRDATVRLRVTVDWDRLSLTTRASGPGYATVEVPVDEAVRKLAERNARIGARPTVDWVYRSSQDEENERLSATLFRNETIALALRKFRTVRVDLDTVDREDVRDDFERTPAFLFFDPAGNLIDRLEGRRVDSQSSFSRRVGKAWAESYEGRLKRYVSEMTDVLDRRDELERERSSLERDRARLAERPNPRKRAALEREEEQLRKAEERLAEAEREADEAVEVREDFRTDGEDETAKRD